MPRLRAIAFAFLLADALIAFVACGSFDDSAEEPATGDGGGAEGGDTDSSNPGDDATASDAEPDRRDAGGGGALLYRKAVLDDEPIAYWRMGDTKSNGSVIRDETSYMNDLTLSNGAPCVGDAGFQTGAPGVFDNDPSVFFSGQCGRGVPGVSTDFAFNGTAEFTLECWARRELPDGGGNGQSFQHLISYVTGSSTGPDGSTQNGYILYLNTLGSGSTAASYGALDGGTIESTGPLLPAGEWGHYVMAVDATNVTLYVNGVERPSVPRTGQLLARPSVLFTLAKASNDERFFRGYLDEVAVYPKRLPQSRIKAHYAIARP